MATASLFSFPTRIHFGLGVRKNVRQYFVDHGLKRPLVVTDRGLAQIDFFKDFVGSLSPDLESSVFSDIFGNPLKSQVEAGVKAFQAHKADSLIAVGGGAALDVGKVIALMSCHEGDLFDYEDGKPKALEIEDKLPFWVALPTTAGTGSEVGRSSVISDDQTHVKKIIFSPKLTSKAVFADPELTFGLPAKITAATGIDALTHCIEAFLSKGFHPLCDGIAMEGIRLIAENLSTCVKEPSHAEARSNMLAASMMGAISFQKGLGLVHSCAHALSAVSDLHHGLANGVMIDHALAFNAKVVADRFQRIAITVGLRKKSSKGVLEWLKSLKTEIGIPAKLSEVGIKEEQIKQLAELAFVDVCHQTNPKPLKRADFKKVFLRAL